ncbi:MAG: helix-turn-helix domain-containing protein [Solobacterium sp.]|nr:helix-turn-helix domain-containing protein [Solobacterium sp.]
MYHELFDGQQGLPFHLFLIDAETCNSHFHPEFEICFILNGQAEFHVDEMVYPLYQHDFLITKPLVLHRINSCSSHCRLLMLHLDQNEFQKYDPAGALERFEFTNSVNNRNTPLYQTLYQSYREMLKAGIEQRPGWKLAMLQQTVRIVRALAESTHVNIDAGSRRSGSAGDGSRKQIREVLVWLDQHWQESFTMEKLARQIHMSPSGFSRFFKNAMGTGFLKYLTELRLNRSLHMLINTDAPIVDIALNCGFNDYKTYGRLFRESYGMSPREYRKSAERPAQHQSADDNVSSEHILSSIPPSFQESSGRTLQILELEPAALPVRSIAMHYGPILSVGPAPALNLGSIQQQLIYSAEQIGARYVQLQVDPSAMNDTGLSSAFYGTQPDDIFGFLFEHQLLPIIAFEPATAENTSYEKVEAFLTSCHRSYMVLSRRLPLAFRLWNLTETDTHPKHEQEERFFPLIRKTVQLIRKLFPDAVLAAPAVRGADHFALFQRFVTYCAENSINFDDMVYDACIFSDINNTSIPTDMVTTASSPGGKYSDTFLQEGLAAMARILRKAGLSPHILVARWPMSVYNQDYTRDTAALPARMLRELTPALSVCRGVICDLSDIKWGESRMEPAEFHGGTGLITRLGIPKPVFSLLRFIRHLGEDCLKTGENFVLTRSRGRYQLLLYSSCPFSEEYLNRRQSLVFEEDRYNIYQMIPDRQFSIRLRVPAGSYIVETFTIDRGSASPYDEWIRMGSPRLNLIQYTDYLRGRSYPGIHTEQQIVQDQLHLDYVLKAHSVVLVIITQS